MSAARAPIAYVRRPSPLHAASGPVAAAYGGALAAAALLSEHPLVLGALLASVLGAGVAAGVGAQMLRTLRFAAVPVLGLTILVNVLVSRQGLTVFARLGDWGVLGQENLTVEALVYGAVFGLRLLVVALACVLVVCAADPDELLLACRRRAPNLALLSALSLRLLPVLAADAARLSEAQRCRCDARRPGPAARLRLLRASVAGALDRSLDVAAVLELRGYCAPSRRSRPRAARAAAAPATRPARSLARVSRHDLAFAAAAALLLSGSLAAAIAGLAPFDAYPLLRAPVDASVAALASALALFALAPFSLRRGVQR